MTGRMRLAGLVVVAVIAVGCTPVQKGTAAGGAVGALSGAAIGQYATSAGGVAGGVIGFGVGAAAGAIAADRYYGSDVDEGALAEATAEADRLSKQLDAREQALKDKDAELEKEKAQEQAMLEAYNNSRNTAAAPAPIASEPPVAAVAPPEVQVSRKATP